MSMRALIEMEFRESFVEIYELRPERRLVTTVKVLSPSNKRYKSPGWFRYCRKRQAHLEGGANLVEIDLLRGGRRMPMEDPWPDSPVLRLGFSQADRTAVQGLAGVLPAAIARNPRPPVPAGCGRAAGPAADDRGDLRASRYALDIDYRQRCRPRLDPAHAQWLQEHLPPAAEKP